MLRSIGAKGLVLALAVFVTASCKAPCSAPAETQDVGPKPANPEALVQRHIDANFHDPGSVKDLEVTAPYKGCARKTPTELEPFPPAIYGWWIPFRASAKNRNGVYGPRRALKLFVRDDEILSVWDDE